MLSAWKAGSSQATAPADAEAQGPLGLESGRLRAWLATALRRKPVSRLRSAALYIQRGLQNLRAELDRRYGASGESDPRATWLAALTPLAFPESKALAVIPSTTAAGFAGIISALVLKNLVLACLAVLGVTGATLLYRTNSAGLEPMAEVVAEAELGAVDDLAPVQLALPDRRAATSDPQTEFPAQKAINIAAHVSLSGAVFGAENLLSASIGGSNSRPWLTCLLVLAIGFVSAGTTWHAANKIERS